jgi:hypothetical protein
MSKLALGTRFNIIFSFTVFSLFQYWDDEIAEMVKGWLSTCVGMVHDKGAQRFSPGMVAMKEALFCRAIASLA